MRTYLWNEPWPGDFLAWSQGGDEGKIRWKGECRVVGFRCSGRQQHIILEPVDLPANRTGVLLKVQWPVLSAGTPINLVITGSVVGEDIDGVVVAIVRHEFKPRPVPSPVA